MAVAEAHGSCDKSEHRTQMWPLCATLRRNVLDIKCICHGRDPLKEHEKIVFCHQSDYPQGLSAQDLSTLQNQAGCRVGAFVTVGILK